MSRARDLANTTTALLVDGTVKLDGNYPVGTGNVALGNTALDSNVSGASNTAIGADALTANTASWNTAVGHQAGYSNTTGLITAVGAQALNQNTTGVSNVAVGGYTTGTDYAAMTFNTTGSYNTAVGSGALQANTTADRNTVVGYEAGYSNTTTNGNTFIGYRAGRDASSGVGNTFIGYDSGYNITSGSYNTFIGPAYSLLNGGVGDTITTGSKNTIIGRYNGNQNGLDIRVWNNYIVLSDGDGNPRGIFDDNGAFLAGATTAINQAHTLTRGVANNTVVVNNTHASNPYGLQVRYSAADPNNSGNIFLEAYGYNGSTLVQRFGVRSNGGIANYQSNDVNLSDERVKKDIAPLGSYWDKIKALGIVTFKYKDQTHDDLNIGVIAQQVEAVAPEFVSNDGMGDTPDDGIPLKTIYTADMYHAAIKALQEAMERIETLEAKVQALENA